MTEVEVHIKRINDKLQHLLKLYQLLKKQNEKLTASLLEINTIRDGEAIEMDNLRQQVNILKSCAGQMPEMDKKVFEKQINQYIKEIDKCIHLLSE